MLASRAAEVEAKARIEALLAGYSLCRRRSAATRHRWGSRVHFTLKRKGAAISDHAFEVQNSAPSEGGRSRLPLSSHLLVSSLRLHSCWEPLCVSALHLFLHLSSCSSQSSAIRVLISVGSRSIQHIGRGACPEG